MPGFMKKVSIMPRKVVVTVSKVVTEGQSIQLPADAIRYYPLAEGDVLAFGRDPECAVILTGENVSRRHCRLMLRDEKILLVDRSKNGTFIGTEKLESDREYPLEVGDSFSIAHQFTVSIGDEERGSLGETQLIPPAV